MTTFTNIETNTVEFRPACQSLELISLHVPKALGTSLREVLFAHYGRHRVDCDYDAFLEDDRPGVRSTTRPRLSASAAVVHGHFPATRYAAVSARHRIAFIREPIRRTISHYFSWVNGAKHGNPIHDRVVDEQLGLLDFAGLPPIRRFYSQTIFGGCGVSGFDLIGVVEDLERDWPRFQRLTGIAAPLPHLNRNRFPSYADIVSKVLADRTLMRMLSRILDEDIRFYERFL